MPAGSVPAELRPGATCQPSAPPAPPEAEAATSTPDARPVDHARLVRVAEALADLLLADLERNPPGQGEASG